MDRTMANGNRIFATLRASLCWAISCALITAAPGSECYGAMERAPLLNNRPANIGRIPILNILPVKAPSLISGPFSRVPEMMPRVPVLLEQAAADIPEAKAIPESAVKEAAGRSFDLSPRREDGGISV